MSVAAGTRHDAATNPYLDPVLFESFLFFNFPTCVTSQALELIPALRDRRQLHPSRE